MKKLFLTITIAMCLFIGCPEPEKSLEPYDASKDKILNPYVHEKIKKDLGIKD
jgi:hypothetical protein